jgi:YHS domain-containing protein
VAAGQHEGHPAGTVGTPSAAQVTLCRQAQPVITGLLDTGLKRLEEARLTNSAAAMRDAADDVQSALIDARTQLAPCGEMQVATTDAHAVHTMPIAQTSPVGVSTQPGSSVSAPAGAAPHAGHAVPTTPQTPAPRAPAAASPRTPAAQPRSTAPVAADPHTGHVMPGVPARQTPAASVRRPSASPAPSAAPAASDTHAGHAVPSTPATESVPAGAARATAVAPPASIADLKCTEAPDPKTAPRMLYQGRMYYFCTEASRAEFAKDPAKYVIAPPQAAPAHAH